MRCCLFWLFILVLKIKPFQLSIPWFLLKFWICHFSLNILKTLLFVSNIKILRFNDFFRLFYSFPLLSSTFYVSTYNSVIVLKSFRSAKFFTFQLSNLRFITKFWPIQFSLGSCVSQFNFFNLKYSN